ncbi:MAG TPA: peroxidase-related enzyme [Chthoniobacterales bacterium]|nr:peroxidase-related enzyme [Chthoniobacterales bacterium]
MCWLKTLPENSGLHNVFQAFPETARPLIVYHETLLRGPSPFSVGERELIAAYVSGLNACAFCHDVHSQTAAAFGIDTQTLRALLADPGSAPVDARLRPVLSFVRKLTLSPSRMTPADAEVVFAAGWDDRALHDAAAICGLFNLMNRLVDGLGIEADTAHTQFVAQHLATTGYAEFLPLL